MPAKPDAERLSLNRARGRLNSTDAYLNGMNRQVKSPSGGEGGFILIRCAPKHTTFSGRLYRELYRTLAEKRA
jgi:hypothetical protein